MRQHPSRYCAAIAAALTLAWAGQIEAAQALAQNVPEIPIEPVEGFIKLPEGLYLGEGIGVAENSQCHIFVYTRSRDTRLFEFAHKVWIDKDDNIWAVDEGSNQVIKFNPEGRVTMVLGYRRVVKYSPDGRFLGQVGSGQRGEEPDQFSTPHTIASDDQGNIHVGDRGNRRVKVYSSDLELLAMYEDTGAPWEVCISEGPHQYLFVSNSNPPDNLDVGGEIYKVALDGTILGSFGTAGKLIGQFGTVNAIDCREENDLLVGELGNWRVQRVTLQPM